MNPQSSTKGAATTGKMGVRIRGAWLKLEENVRGRWSAYDEAGFGVRGVGSGV